ncbi:MAG TPA: Trm112 family protein [Dokdonella sp.]|uniref:Trm112 family protein n=1 Tax=Dokdonella sp. TaxID=2291710 RepID=UPI002BB1BAB9|nr:Trm112 family protein [Dokdonella sp.]HUD43003.1 Trm112 family protein [Dokdonella sp.]
MDQRLLSLLRCPASQAALRALRRDELDALNRAIAAGSATLADGQPWRTPLQAALITEDRARVYRIEDGIPVMLADQAIPAAGIDGLGVA